MTTKVHQCIELYRDVMEGLIDNAPTKEFIDMYMYLRASMVVYNDIKNDANGFYYSNISKILTEHKL